MTKIPNEPETEMPDYVPKEFKKEPQINGRLVDRTVNEFDFALQSQDNNSNYSLLSAGDKGALLGSETVNTAAHADDIGLNIQVNDLIFPPLITVKLFHDILLNFKFRMTCTMRHVMYLTLLYYPTLLTTPDLVPWTHTQNLMDMF